MAPLGLNDPVTAFHYSTQPRRRSSSICIVIILVFIAVARIVKFKNIITLINIVAYGWGGVTLQNAQPSLPIMALCHDVCI